MNCRLVDDQFTPTNLICYSGFQAITASRLAFDVSLVRDGVRDLVMVRLEAQMTARTAVRFYISIDAIVTLVVIVIIIIVTFSIDVVINVFVALFWRERVRVVLQEDVGARLFNLAVGRVVPVVERLVRHSAVRFRCVGRIRRFGCNVLRRCE